MSAFRKSGSFVALTWTGNLGIDTAEVAEQLRAKRFRTIERAASEERSFGWVTKADPTGDSFDPEDLLAGKAFWFRMRSDVKKLPSSLVQRHIAVAEKTRGKRLSARERRELKADLADKVLPGILPTSTNTDLLVFTNEGNRVLLFTTSKSVCDTVRGLWLGSFGMPLELLDPLGAAMLDADEQTRAAVQKLEPMRWAMTTGGAK